ncbi:MAG: transporter [Bacteroidales bacterium]|nr:transporter [Bacteroidales bacterium]
MLQREKTFLKNWMLPLAMTVGAVIYLILHYVPSFNEEGYMSVARNLQPVLVSLMLFLQLNTVAPTDLKFHKWHFILIAVQALLFAVFAFIAAGSSSAGGRILLESAMLCFICPTAAAAGVITSKIGGSLPGIMTYTVLSDTLASLLIPLMIPMVHPAADMSFLAAFWAIIKRVFSILVLPCVLAWLIRYLLPGVQRWLAKYVGWAFYVWSVGLVLALSLATGALVTSRIGLLLTLGIAVVSLVCCIFQFWLGRRVARGYGRVESVTAGQALGQKNTGFIIWLGFRYMTPVTSVAGGLYAIWHNLVNSYELYKSRQNG